MRPDEIYFRYPELSGNIFKKLLKRIKKRIKKKGGTYKIVTPKGEATISPEGIDITRTDQPAKSGFIDFKETAGGIFSNPVMLAIPAGIILLSILKKRK